MRGDEQIVFTAGNAPLRCGRAIWFRRKDMSACVGANRFHKHATKEAGPNETGPTTGTEETRD